MTHLLRHATIGVLALLAGGCGGGGGSSPTPSGTPFVSFFANVYAMPAEPNPPVPISNLVFTGQFTDDETTFDFLLP